MIKRITTISISIILLSVLIVMMVLPSAAVSTDQIVESAVMIIHTSEGNYGSVAKDDNGAVSIGYLQWHANRALNLLKTIINANITQAKSILSTSLYEEIMSSSTSWSTRIVNDSEAKQISTLLDTTEGHEAQDSLAKENVTSYVNHGLGLGIVDPTALVYFADLENQCGAGGSGRIAEAASKIAGSYDKITLDILHQASLEDSVAGRYAARRSKAYNACALLGWTELDYDYEIWTVNKGIALNIRSGPNTSYKLVSSIGEYSKIIITEKYAEDEYTWGKTLLGWVCIAEPYCTFTQSHGDIPAPVLFNTDGGYVSGDLRTFTITADGYNVSRTANKLVVMDSNYGTKSGTNNYGRECAVSSDGEVLNAPLYGVGDVKIPDGGFVVTGHGTASDFLKNCIAKGWYISFNKSDLTITVYVSRDNYSLNSKKASDGKPIGYLPNIVKENYVFNGWYDSSSTLWTESSVYTGHYVLILSSKWKTASNTTITYELDGGCFEGVVSHEINGINSSRLANYLNIYNTGSAASTNMYGSEVQVDSNGIVTAVYPYPSGSTKIPVGGFVISGHGTSSDWIKNNIKVGKFVIFDSSAKMVYVYDSKEVYNSLNTEAVAGSPIGKLPTAKKEYHKFLGWYTPTGAKATENTIVPSGGIVLTARWEVIPGTVTFNMVGGSYESAITTFTITGKNTNRTANSLIKYDASYSKTTNTNSYGSEVMISEDGFVSMVFPYGKCDNPIPSSGYILSGHGTASTWIQNNLKPGQYIHIENNKISVYSSYETYSNPRVSAMTVKYNTPIGELPYPVKTGYVFDGWEKPNGVVIVAGDYVDFYGDAVLKARWVPVYEVTMNLSSGNIVPNATITANSINGLRTANTLIICTAKKNTDTNIYGTEALTDPDGMVIGIYGYGSGDIKIPGGCSVISGHGTGATWIKNNLQVGYYVKFEGTLIKVYHSYISKNASNGKVYVNAGSTIGELPNIERSGSNFLGWYINNTKATSTTKVNGNITLSASWETSKSKVVLSLEGGTLKSNSSTYVLTGTNTHRVANSLILYKDKKTTGTNNYGTEVLVSADNAVVAIMSNGWGDNYIPTGCYILSAHGTAATWVNGNISLGNYIYISQNTVKVCSTKAEYLYLCGELYVEKGKSYGDLPIPQKSKNVFIGWKNYNGDIVSSSDIVGSANLSTLTAVWAEEIKVEFSGMKFDSPQTTTINGYNCHRSANTIILFAGDSKTGTNNYGTEAVIDKNGKVLSVVGKGNSTIPSDGYVLSGHGTGSNWISSNIKVGNYIVVKGARIYVYASYADYKATIGFTAASGYEIGELPKLKSPYSGWYNGTVKVTEKTILVGNTTLIAK